jgi:DNA-binding NarL/FixJ family response regulator
MFREGLVALLSSSDAAVVAEVSTCADLLERLHTHTPDVLLMNADLTGGDALELLPTIKASLPDVSVIILDGSTDGARRVYQAVRLGASGYLFTSASSADLLAAIRLAASKQVALPADSLNQLVGFLTAAQQPSQPSDGGVERLTRREEEVLELVAQGLSNKAISEALYLTESTVRSHVNNILGKLGLANRVQAATYALQRRHASKPLVRAAHSAA